MTGLGIDIGGTNARVAHVESSGKVTSSAKATLSDHSVEAVVEVVARLVRELGGAVPAQVGVGFAGMLRGPVVVNAPNFGWREVDLGTPLSRALGTQVRLVNDLAAAAWGEHAAGVAHGCADTFTVFVGTGVGSAIIEKGRLLTGATGVAGEFGHLKVVADGGRSCGCGQTGCLEAYMGGAKLTEWMREEHLDGSIAELEQRALAGEPKSRALYDFAVGHLALAIANQVTVLNPAMVVLGGGVLLRCPGVISTIRQVVARRSAVAAAAAVRVELAQLGDDSGLVGAALLA
jgi:glucokinase